MHKTQTLEWNCFMKGDILRKELKCKKIMPTILTGIWVANKSIIVSAAEINDSTGLGRLISEILGIADYIAWGGLIFAGASWMFNNRTVAIERGIGVTAGYLIIRKSWAYIQFLKGI
ncbi:hypothetical protein [Heyndrickxia sporothermodurans]|uniref:Uncharacterized protein n=3 Tax=Heyndrickxia sporothermodurans TaxID=46224 RepID=A0AB37HB48_9BACI|nr:hypothetical protein [Heyndrickxia sporothermodurans]MED1711684.1 hypothetical protein [Bacillus thuringiensis]MBL5767742.1 hypothetical protein [Heyndrickxia sporothermodurans]MBL5771248.1 hypothetical protein [Heyndrickxia sporothermodurans]MBL5780056.1 hypothetical protein [Heyndrickxia sporothermodurans]MBL5785618.1 hypothetical protein [Heyndrickxia sporothermodurans]